MNGHNPTTISPSKNPNQYPFLILKLLATQCTISDMPMQMHACLSPSYLNPILQGDNRIVMDTLVSQMLVVMEPTAGDKYKVIVVLRFLTSLPTTVML